MTDEEIDSLVAGHEMDALIAEHVFQWKWLQYLNMSTAKAHRYLAPKETNPLSYPVVILHIPHYSTSIEDAWKIVDKFGFVIDARTNTTIVYSVYFGREEEMGRAFGSAPLAICKAGLRKAMGKTE